MASLGLEILGWLVALWALLLGLYVAGWLMWKLKYAVLTVVGAFVLAVLLLRF